MSKPLNDLLRQWHECLTTKAEDYESVCDDNFLD